MPEVEYVRRTVRKITRGNLAQVRRENIDIVNSVELNKLNIEDAVMRLPREILESALETKVGVIAPSVDNLSRNKIVRITNIIGILTKIVDEDGHLSNDVIESIERILHL